LNQERREDVFRYIWGIAKNKKCHLYRINGVEDHIHILTSLHPSVCLSGLVKDIKVSSSKWIKENGVFPHFTHWQDGYGAFTDNDREKKRLIEYIKKQETHHKKVSFVDEYKALLLEAGIEFDDTYLL
jgi:REP element-mobilizing transposase RayT